LKIRLLKQHHSRTPRELDCCENSEQGVRIRPNVRGPGDALRAILIQKRAWFRRLPGRQTGDGNHSQNEKCESRNRSAVIQAAHLHTSPVPPRRTQHSDVFYKNLFKPY
jgi:hypothetical protein